MSITPEVQNALNVIQKALGAPAAAPAVTYPPAAAKFPLPTQSDTDAAFQFLCAGVEKFAPCGASQGASGGMYPDPGAFGSAYVFATKEAILAQHVFCLGLLGLPKDQATNGSIRFQAYAKSHNQAIDGAVFGHVSVVGAPDIRLDQILAVIPGGGPIPPYPGDSESILAAKRGGLVINGPNGPLYGRDGVPIKY